LKRILVIKLGALGDFVLAFGPFATIRAHHPGAAITLLTTAPFADLARAAPWFDTVVIDSRPAWWNFPGLLRLRRTLRGFDMVYDLQTSSRSSRYHWLAGAPPWSGIAGGATHPHATPNRNAMHTVERQQDQLRMAGITEFAVPDITWLAQVPPEMLPEPYAVLVPGAAPHRPRKRWPATHFGALATLLSGKGVTPVIVGTRQDAPLAASIRAIHPAAIDLTGRTSLRQLAAVASGASFAVGNDTGPLHLAAATGIPCIALFSDESDPALTSPRGQVTVLSAPSLADLSVQRVAEALPPVH
jgi:ADP-heptose:LPS heptosyltransferase